MQDESPRRRDKQNGEWAEMQFVADAMRYGFEVFKPIGDSTAADVILIWEHRLITIQVKSTFTDNNGKSKWNIGKGSSAKKRYTDDDVDFLALYDGNIDRWRFVRPSETNGQKTFRVLQNETNKLDNWNDLTTTRRR
jgi:hypothetical protein